MNRDFGVIEVALAEQAFNIDSQSGFFETFSGGASRTRLSRLALSARKLRLAGEMGLLSANADKNSPISFDDSNSDLLA